MTFDGCDLWWEGYYWYLRGRVHQCDIVGPSEHKASGLTMPVLLMWTQSSALSLSSVAGKRWLRPGELCNKRNFPDEVKL